MKEYRSMDFVWEDGKLVKSTSTVQLSEKLALGVSICPKSGLPLFRAHTWPDITLLIKAELLERLSDEELYVALKGAFAQALDPVTGLFVEGKG